MLLRKDFDDQIAGLRMTKPRIVSLLLGFLGTNFVGMCVVYVLLSDVDFARRAARCSAVVKNVTTGGRSGLVFADVDLDLPNGPVHSKLETWYTTVPVGRRLSVLYWTDDPDHVVLNGFWHLYFRSIIGLICLMVVAAIEATAYRARCRRREQRGSLLRG
jgi:hypothetical protein